MSTNEERILHETTIYVRNLCEGDSSGHDWWHIERVRQTALVIAKQEGADLFVVEMAALLHDVADRKFNSSLEAGIVKVSHYLDSQSISEVDK